mgnify:CR=1 FL=1
MSTTIENVELSGPAGRLEGLLNVPDGAVSRVALVCHPHPLHGGTMHNNVVYHTARALRERGLAVLRFNFRGVGRSPGTFDEGRGEQDDFRAAVDFAAATFPGLEIWGGGGSFGSYVGMTASSLDPRVSARIGIAPPVNRYDFSTVTETAKPTFLIHGEEDELIPIELVREFYGTLAEPKELIVIERANHLFDGQASEVGDALADLLEDFSTRA